MEEPTDEYAHRADYFEAKSEAAEDPIIKFTYRELARSYRTLATYVPRAERQSAAE